MKNLLITLAALFGSCISHAKTLTLKNNTGDSMIIAMVWYNKAQQCWESRGWQKLQPYEQKNIGLKGSGKNKVYVYGQTKTKAWKGDKIFMIDSIGFDIFYADQIKSDAKTEPFTEIDVSNDETTYVFN